MMETKYIEDRAMIQLDDLDWELADCLVERALKKWSNISYRDQAAELTKRLGRTIDPHFGLSEALYKVADLCFELGLPLVSAKVTHVYTGASRGPQPGPGFYPMACEKRPEYKKMSSDAAWQNEIKLIKECNEWQRLRDFLDGKSYETRPDSIVDLPAAIEPKQEQPTPDVPSIMDEPVIRETNPVFPDEVDESHGPIQEGAVKSVNVNVHERNPAARQKCIEYHSTTCAVCGIDLGDIYGEEFSWKIHVHHLKPISEYDGVHDIDPVNDLRPVCPNCHMVIHCRQDKPYSIEEVKAFIASVRSEA